LPEAGFLVTAQAVEIRLGERLKSGDAGRAAGGAEIDVGFQAAAPEPVVELGDFALGGQRKIRQIGDAIDRRRARQFLTVEGGIGAGVRDGFCNAFPPAVRVFTLPILERRKCRRNETRMYNRGFA
jgi:hypothetical protein